MPTPSAQPPRGLSPVERLDRAARIRFRQRLALTLGPILLALLAALAITLHKPRVYSSTATFQVLPNAVEGAGPQIQLPSWYRPIPHDFSTDAELITSPTFLRTVAHALPKDVQAELLEDDPDAYSPAQREAILADSLAEDLDIGQRERDELFTVTYLALTPRTAALVVNQVVDSFSHLAIDLANARSKRLAAFLDTQLQTLRQRIQQDQARENQIERSSNFTLREAQRAAGSAYKFEFGPDDDTDIALPPLLAAARQARFDRNLLNARLRLLQALTRDHAALPDDSPILATLRLSLAQAQQDYAVLAIQLGPNHPDLLARAANLAALNRQLAAAQASAVASIRAQAGIAAANARTLTARAAQRAAQLDRIAALEVEQSTLSLDLALNLSVYEELRGRIGSQRLRAGLETPTILPVDPALAPLEPAPRPYARTTAIALALAILAAFLLRLAHARRSARSWTVPEVEAAIALPALTLLPHAPDPHALHDSEELRMLEHALQLLPAALKSRRHPGCTVFLFTSATPSEGKTTTAASFAAMLARHGAPTLLLDADLHRPSVHHFLSLSGRQGLTTLLNDAASPSLEDLLTQPARHPGLDVLPAGPVPPSPSTLLASARLPRLLAQAAATHRYIVLDSAPILPLTDAVALSAHADLVLLVARYGAVTLDQLSRAHDLLARAHAPLAGLILNATPPT